MSLIAASLPGVDLKLFCTDASPPPDEDVAPSAWTDWLGLREEIPYQLILLTDPFSCPAETIVAGLDYSWPGTAKVGGWLAGQGRRSRMPFL